MPAFDYPTTALTRRHGPQGYTNYQPYRDWLRDEFTFRCVYCLKREQWGQMCGDIDLEHFKPQSSNPELGTEYDNLLYSCHACNLRKSDNHLDDDPCLALTRDDVEVLPDGSIEGRSAEAKRLIEVLGLNSELYIDWRLLWIRIVELAEEDDPDHYVRLMKYPDNLPDLSRKRPVNNLRPQGVNDSYFERRKRDELAETY